MKQITLTLALLIASLSYGQVVINEIDSDQTGTDAMEFVELFSATPNQSLDGLVLVLFNGSDDASYNAVDLTGSSTDANGYFVIGGDDVPNADITIGATNVLQNGADAVAIYTGTADDFPTDTPATTTNLIDAVVYGTSDGDDAELLAALGETTQYDENANGLKDTESLQLNEGEFCASAPTPKAENVCEEAMITEVANIGELRAGTQGTIYNLTGEALLTFQQDFRNQKYIEDNTGAILIDDSAGIITTAYEVGDGITGITGTLGSFGGTLQFVPTQDSGAASSTGNTLNPQVVTATMLTDNPTDYESEYVQILDTTIDNTNSTTWDNGETYLLSTDAGSYTFRAAFFDVDYIGTTVPASATIAGIITRNDDMSFITARNLSDIEATSAGCPLAIGDIVVTCDTETTGQDGTTIAINYTGGGGATYDVSVDVGVISGDDPSAVSDGTIIITEISENANIIVFITSDLCDLELTIDTPVCEPAPEAATIAELRTGDLGTEYTLTGEAVLTFQQAQRNQKWIEDETAAILIDDNAGIITTSYEIGDGITGITGTLSEFNGLLQFVPSEDPGDATSSDNEITPQVVATDELTANGEDYESEYVVVVESTIGNDTGNAMWMMDTNYDLTTTDGTITLRTNFDDADYIGDTIPTETVNLAGLVGQFDNNDDDVDEGYQITPRFTTDIDVSLSVSQTEQAIVSVFPNPAKDVITISTGTSSQKTVTIYNITGQKVKEVTTENTVNVGSLPNGMYLVKVTEANRTMTTKLIIK